MKSRNDAIPSRRRDTNNGMYAFKVDSNVMRSNMDQLHKIRKTEEFTNDKDCGQDLLISSFLHLFGSRAERTWI